MRKKGKITLILAALMIAAGIIFYKHKQHQKQLALERLQAYHDSIYKAEEAIEEARRIAEEREQRRLHDSTVRAERLPISDEELIAMVKKYAPAYSDIILWRQTKEDWIMHYLREIKYKKHFYLRQFNPVKNSFGKEREIIYDSTDPWEPIGQRYRSDYYHFKDDPNSTIRRDERGFKITSKNLNGLWNQDWTNVTTIWKSAKSPSEIRKERLARRHRCCYYDDYEDYEEEREHEEYDEDCPENNELDINLYYNPKYKPK